MRTQATTASGSVPVKDGQVVRTTLGTWVKAITRALEAAGCDSAALLAEAGFDLKSLDGPNVRCPLTQTERLWRLAVRATRDPAFGIKVASHIKQTTFHALSFGLPIALAFAMANAQADDTQNTLKIGYAHIGFNTRSGDLTGPTGTTPPGVQAELNNGNALAARRVKMNRNPPSFSAFSRCSGS